MSRLRVTLYADEGSNIPIYYKYYLQSMIYNSISSELSKFLHNKGFQVGKRRFKLFTFSDLIGYKRLSIEEGIISLKGDIYLYVSSPIDRFIEEFGNSILRKDRIYIGDTSFKVKEVYIVPNKDISSEIIIKTLSPIVVYSTLYTADNRKKTYYYSPYEPEFNKLITENAKKKYTALYGKEYKGTLELRPLKTREIVTRYKETIVRGWIGKFVLKGDTPLIEVVYESGLGSKNPQGFGMFEIL